MRQLKTFEYALKNSLFDISYYKDVIKAPFSFSLKYLGFFLFLISLIYTLQFTYNFAKVIPQLPEIKSTIRDTVVNLYPEDLVVTINNGIVSTNSEEPVYIHFSPKLREYINKEKIYNTDTFSPFYLAVIDTNALPSDYYEYRAMFLLTKDSFVYYNEDGYEVKLLREIEGRHVITHDEYNKVIRDTLPYIESLDTIIYVLIIFMAVILPFAITALWLLWELFYLLIATVLIYLAAAILKKGLEYSQVYKIGMHTITWPILLTTILSFFELGFPLLFTLIFVLYTSIVIYNLPVVKKQS